MSMLQVLEREHCVDLPANHLLTGGVARLSKTGQSVAVTLYGPHDPRAALREFPYPIPMHRVYLPLDCVAAATEPQHLLNAASHKSTRWLEEIKADYWHGLLVVVCRPVRPSKSLLTAICKVARNTWGDKYWRNADARAMLTRELSLMGVKCPPPVSVLPFMALIKEN